MAGGVHEAPGLIFVPVVAVLTFAVTIHFNLVIAAIQRCIVRAGGEEEGRYQERDGKGTGIHVIVSSWQLVVCGWQSLRPNPHRELQLETEPQSLQHLTSNPSATSVISVVKE